MFLLSFYLSFVHATINTSTEFCKEDVFILLNQIILLDESPRGRVGRPKNMRIIIDFPLFCSIAFAKNPFDRLHWQQQHMNVLIFQCYVHRLKF